MSHQPNAPATLAIDIFKQSELRHLAFTQYYRWFQVYERPYTDARIHNQLDILSDHILIDSISGISEGKNAQKEKIKMFEGMKNAHHLKQIDFNIVDESTLELNAEIIYQGIRPDNQKVSFPVRYNTVLSLQNQNLPLFTHFKLRPDKQIDSFNFEDAYAKNRASSFMHYWFYCVETANGDPSRFKELFADHYELNFSTSCKIETWSKFEHWLKETNAQLKRIAHHEKNFSAAEQPDGSILVNADIEWEGLSHDNKPKTGSAHYSWVLENDLDSRFAKIKKIDIT